MIHGQSVRRLRTVVAASAIAALLGGCISASAGPQGVYATPIGNAPVTANPTPYSAALYCMADYARRYNLPSPRMAVGRISDYTGTVSADGGRQITGGASQMAMTALAKAGARQVERYDTSVSEMELRYANNRLIGDEGPAGADDNQYRRILAGQVPGSDFYIAGGITELNYNIRSSGIDVAGGDPTPTDFKGRLGGRSFVMNVGLDLRMINTRTLEVVDVISYQKQVVGREVSLGVFDFWNGNLFDISAGTGALEPLQLAVRGLVERAVVEMTANLYGMAGPQSCLTADPLAGGTTGMTGGFTPAYDNLRTNNAQTREDPNRWNEKRDPEAGRALRGRY